MLGSPEVLGTLAWAGDIQPLDVQRITGYPQLSPRLRAAPSELYDGKLYGMPYSWDFYVTGYDPAVVKPAPQSWDTLFEPASAARYAHRITVPDSPVTLALAALYLKSAQPSLGITDPFELTEPQLAAAQQAVIAIRPSVGSFWSQDSDVVGPLGDGQYVLGAVLNHQIEEMSRAGLPTAGWPAPAATAGQGPAVADVQSWMMTAKSPNSSCMYKWLSWSASADVQEARLRLYQRRAGEPGGLPRRGRGQLRPVPRVEPAGGAEHRVRAPTGRRLRQRADQLHQLRAVADRLAACQPAARGHGHGHGQHGQLTTRAADHGNGRFGSPVAVRGAGGPEWVRGSFGRRRGRPQRPAARCRRARLDGLDRHPGSGCDPA